MSYGNVSLIVLLKFPVNQGTHIKSLERAAARCYRLQCFRHGAAHGIIPNGPLRPDYDYCWQWDLTILCGIAMDDVTDEKMGDCNDGCGKWATKAPARPHRRGVKTRPIAIRSVPRHDATNGMCATILPVIAPPKLKIDSRNPLVSIRPATAGDVTVR